MKATEQTLQQLERALRKVAEKFPASEEASLLTDIHLQVNQETGELTVFDDDDKEITRCVVEQWIGNTDSSFYSDAADVLRSLFNKHAKMFEQMSILKPYSFVLENDDHEHLAELYLVDDDTVIISKELMTGLDKDLNDFLAKLLSED